MFDLVTEPAEEKKGKPVPVAEIGRRFHFLDPPVACMPTGTLVVVHGQRVLMVDGKRCLHQQAGYTDHDQAKWCSVRPPVQQPWQNVPQAQCNRLEGQQNEGSL